MTKSQLAYKRAESPHETMADVPRYYVWVERPRTPDFDGGEPPVEWTRQERGGHL